MDIKYEVIITERAREELKEIYDYISKSLMEENTANEVYIIRIVYGGRNYLNEI